MIQEKIATEIIQIINTQQAWHYEILPYKKTADELFFYIAEEKYDPEVAEELEVLLGFSVILTKMDREFLQKILVQYYRKTENRNIQSQNISWQEEQTKSFLVTLITEAKQLGSSDIHLEAFENRARIRMRIDGKLVERYMLEKSNYPSLVNKIKIQSNLDIAEKRLPQDGRIFIQLNEQEKLDIRVSILPTLHGEKIVLRLLSNDSSNLDLTKLGLAEKDLKNYLESVKRPNGIVLISGPTGSGKTTTLYATLQDLNKTTTNIITIEDPIEYTLEGINQVQLRENIGLDFPSAMRTFLRQDPDVIMVGEIRDQATAAMAIRASLTGHLVLSTIHTNSAWGIVARLIDMGIPSYLLADTLNATIAQRLVRKLCPACKKQKTLADDLFPRRYKAPRKLDFHYLAEGCDQCFFTGYKGRVAVYEVIPIDYELSKNIKASNLDVDDLLKERGIQSLSHNAFALIEEGITSIEEIYPILASS